MIGDGLLLCGAALRAVHFLIDALAALALVSAVGFEAGYLMPVAAQGGCLGRGAFVRLFIEALMTGVEKEGR